MTGNLSITGNKPIVLLHNIDFSITENTFSNVLQSVRKEKRDKINKFRFREDALRSLFGELLLKYALEKFCNVKYEEELFSENEFGKPILANRDFHFNISHSGSWSVAAFHSFPIGIDVEEIKTPPYEIMQNYFTEIEKSWIEKSYSEEKAKKFFKLWTLKESYIKMLGKGLSLGLDSFSIIIKGDYIIVEDKNRQTENVGFNLFSPDVKHIAALCFSGTIDNQNLPQLIGITDLI